MQQSAPFNGKVFENPVPTEMMGRGAIWRLLKKMFQQHPNREPGKVMGPFVVDETRLQQPLAPRGITVTWLGHSSVLLDIDGKRFLTDPLWYQRASPFAYAGPKRFFANPLSIDNLPPIDAILLSHDHYDHLDKKSILRLTAAGLPVITMLGVGRRLRQWGVAANLVTELDWWQSVRVGDHVITATPARHFSGRWLHDRFTTLWGSFAIKGETHNVYFGADSGYFNGFAEIGRTLGPFDLALLEIGAYNEEWEAIHMGPENAVQATLDLQASLLLPIHWATFNLALHPWTEPVERLQAEAAKKGLPLLLPAPGETCTAADTGYNSGWWLSFQ